MSRPHAPRGARGNSGGARISSQSRSKMRQRVPIRERRRFGPASRDFRTRCMTSPLRVFIPDVASLSPLTRPRSAFGTLRHRATAARVSGNNSCPVCGPDDGAASIPLWPTRLPRRPFTRLDQCRHRNDDDRYRPTRLSITRGSSSFDTTPVREARRGLCSTSAHTAAPLEAWHIRPAELLRTARCRARHIVETRKITRT
jgi:hypothetical protein